MGVSYIPVARVGELAAGAMKEVDLGGRQVFWRLSKENILRSRGNVRMKKRILKPGHSKAARFAAPITIIAST